MLAPFGRPGRTVTAVLGTPALLVLTVVLVNEYGVPWGVWPGVAVCAPAALSWGRPRRQRRDTVGQRDVRCPPDRAPHGP